MANGKHPKSQPDVFPQPWPSDNNHRNLQTHQICSAARFQRFQTQQSGAKEKKRKKGVAIWSARPSPPLEFKAYGGVRHTRGAQSLRRAEGFPPSAGTQLSVCGHQRNALRVKNLSHCYIIGIFREILQTAKNFALWN